MVLKELGDSTLAAKVDAESPWDPSGDSSSSSPIEFELERRPNMPVSRCGSSLERKLGIELAWMPKKSWLCVEV